MVVRTAVVRGHQGRARQSQIRRRWIRSYGRPPFPHRPLLLEIGRDRRLHWGTPWQAGRGRAKSEGRPCCRRRLPRPRDATRAAPHPRQRWVQSHPPPPLRVQGLVSVNESTELLLLLKAGLISHHLMSPNRAHGSSCANEDKDFLEHNVWHLLLHRHQILRHQVKLELSGARELPMIRENQ